MADETVRKRVDEDWKSQVDQEQTHVADSPAPAAGQPPVAPAGAAEPAAPETHGELPAEARFDVFVSGLSMEALVGLGDLPHPVTKKRAVNLAQAKYLIDLLGVLEDKTRGNLTPDESQLLNDVLYQLRMRYLGKTQT